MSTEAVNHIKSPCVAHLDGVDPNWRDLGNSSRNREKRRRPAGWVIPKGGLSQPASSRAPPPSAAPGEIETFYKPITLGVV